MARCYAQDLEASKICLRQPTLACGTNPTLSDSGTFSRQVASIVTTPSGGGARAHEQDEGSQEEVGQLHQIRI